MLPAACQDDGLDPKDVKARERQAKAAAKKAFHLLS
jgi:hypothetical protein